MRNKPFFFLILFLLIFLPFHGLKAEESSKGSEIYTEGMELYEQGKYDEARKKFESALDFAMKEKDSELEAGCYNNIGLVYDNQGRYEEALENYQKALKIALKALGEEHPSVATSYNNIGAVYYEKKEYKEAKESFETSISIIEKVRKRAGLEGKTKAAFLATKLFTYKALISTLYYLQDFSSAFYTLELSHARSLLDEVSQNALFQSKEIDESFINTLKELKEKVVRLYNLIANKKSQGQKTDEDERQTFQLETEYKNTLNEIYTKYPKFKALTEAKIVKAEEAQKLLGEKEALIEYSLGEEGSFAFVITKESLQMVKLPTIKVKDTVEVFRETIKYPINKKENYYAKGDVLLTERSVKIIKKEKEEKEFQEINYKSAQKQANAQLYSALIEPVLPYMKEKENIIIVPDAELSFLPFEALKDTEGKYLIEKKNISYIQSASLLAKVMEKKTAAGSPLLSFGGALYEAGGTTPVQKEGIYLSEAEKQYYKQQTEVLLAQRGALNSVYDEKGYEWSNLPGTEEEVKQIGSLFYEKEEDKNNHTLVGNKVTEERIKQMSKEGILKNYKILHFATHGLVELDVPELSAIVLSQPDAIGEKDAKEDGYLTMGEIMTLNLNSELVNLSACETGLGKLVGGEGVTGLTQSFIMAGASNVSVSLWSVADVSTRDFMVSFYTKVKGGESYKQAMVETKREFINRKWSEPYFLAAFWVEGGEIKLMAGLKGWPLQNTKYLRPSVVPNSFLVYSNMEEQ